MNKNNSLVDFNTPNAQSTIFDLRSTLFIFLGLIFAMTTHPDMSIASVGNSSTHPIRIMIDPGHGGRDKGAVRGRLKESEIALEVSLRLAQFLRQDRRFQVAMTRTKDSTLTLQQRTDLAKSNKSDLFISIHINSSTDQRAIGQEFYFQNQLPADQEALFLANQENVGQDENKADKAETVTFNQKNRDLVSSDLRAILDDLHRNERIMSSSELCQTFHENWAYSHSENGSRAIRQAPFFVVSNLEIPSVLVELGFLSHPLESRLLGQTDYQSELAKNLYEGLVKYKETMDKDATLALQSAHEN